MNSEETTKTSSQEQRRPKRAPREEAEWFPKTSLGKLVKAGRITLDEIFGHSLCIREPEIIDYFLKATLKEEVLVIKSVQKQTKAGQKTRMKVVLALGDHNNYIGIGSGVARDVVSAINAAKVVAKCSMRPIKKGFWGNEIGEAHTVPVKALGKCGSVKVQVTPAPKGTGLVAGGVSKTIFKLAGIKDIFTSSKGQTCTTENFARASLYAITNSTNFNMPNVIEEKVVELNPILKNAEFLIEQEQRDLR
ncbi:40S ribosomal protein S2 [Spraguea lophii 42_110]|uniref:Small ribosomal subunit protein uS5 n=1 Tax=Spraguea lophii (strain 42_110) TaxID=1358809 RepID=S7W7R5_SPRLO|nr:Chain SC0, 40S ribosomal protein S2 [Spraguea lophii 42_110]7QJH_RC0 Chain RC0, 40S ribosomal protein S2 [Spraguea lophii 42_110]7QJH_SC0 Chain SC0, 40S ribosomal protein S2 [Spraguea lophii 42_110]8BR3_SC0 Chain SC0, 40S ribosomal protein S2 [Spraguea lophii 42_110]8P5D_SC0 Chain SC0, 40S ribosomal protein S2 [Spraguea lophii 42_110]8P60_RC0 Chain RC0, 40S ribosomal protein S2 [Spraguea lophii 42_110]8P60_SC0 Chain SC0, 40S ribosomal protein S2 [Spraguea lophii 42_110]EPR77747.1 40S ribo